MQEHKAWLCLNLALYNVNKHMQIKNFDTQKIIAHAMRLSDMRVAGQTVFVIIVLLVSWSGIKTIQTNYALQKQISAMKQRNEVQKLENENLTLQNEYYKSNQYLELAARQDLGLAMPGEKEVIVPVSVAKNYVATIPAETGEKEVKRKPTFFERNISGWLDFFFHRQSED